MQCLLIDHGHSYSFKNGQEEFNLAFFMFLPVQDREMKILYMRTLLSLRGADGSDVTVKLEPDPSTLPQLPCAFKFSQLN